MPDKHRANPLRSLAGVFTGRETRSISLRDPANVFNRLLDEVMRLPDLGDRKVLLRSDMVPALLNLPENTRAEAYYRLLDAVNEIFSLARIATKVATMQSQQAFRQMIG